MYDPRSSYELAVRIKDDENYEEESRYRTAINRVYFSLIQMMIEMYRKSVHRIENSESTPAWETG